MLVTARKSAIGANDRKTGIFYNVVSNYPGTMVASTHIPF